MKVILIGCVQMSRDFLEVSLRNPKIKVVGVITRSVSKFNSDFTSLEPLAQQHNIPCLALEQNDQDKIFEFSQKHGPDMIFCCGWSYLLDNRTLNLPPRGVLGFHPTALPKNRGRHPLIWALALGLSETASTFFLMDEGADTGPILSQKNIKISSRDDAHSLYKKVAKVAKSQLKEIILKLAAQSLRPQKQNHSRANSWRKRNHKDGKIDWRMSAKSIYNLVRALSQPYPGAHCEIEGREFKVWKTKVITSRGFENCEPGKVLKVTKNTMTIKCGQDALILLKHELESCKEGTYL